MRRPSCYIVFAITAISWLASCETEKAPPSTKAPHIAVAFRETNHEAAEGFELGKDETGQPLYIAQTPFLTESDIRIASLVQSERRSLVQFEFYPVGADRLTRVTGSRPGVRLAVFVDGKLVMTPILWQPITSGKVLLDGGFDRKRAAEIVRLINAQRVEWRAQMLDRSPPPGERP